MQKFPSQVTGNSNIFSNKSASASEVFVQAALKLTDVQTEIKMTSHTREF